MAQPINNPAKRGFGENMDENKQKETSPRNERPGQENRGNVRDQSGSTSPASTPGYQDDQDADLEEGEDLQQRRQASK